MNTREDMESYPRLIVQVSDLVVSGEKGTVLKKAMVLFLEMD